MNTFVCVSGMTVESGPLAAALTVVSLVSLSLVSLLCLRCKKKSSELPLFLQYLTSAGVKIQTEPEAFLFQPRVITFKFMMGGRLINGWGGSTVSLNVLLSCK